MANEKIERKYLAHFIDAAFSAEAPEYERIGKDLEEFNEELNPQVEVSKNILGEQAVIHSGYEVQSEVSPFYAREGDKMFDKLDTIVNNRSTGADCATTVVDVLFDASGEVKWAYRENVVIAPTSRGGDTSGIQIPYTIYRDGSRVKGTWDKASNKFTPGEE